MTLQKKILLLGCALALAGCASTPTQYLTLSAPTPLPAHQTLQGRGLPVLIAHVQMPADIDRLYLTTLQGQYRLEVANHVRWAAPLGGMAQKVMAEDLAGELPDHSVLMPGDPLPRGPYLLVTVNIQSFLPSNDGQVVLRADWFIQHIPDGQIQARGRNQFDQDHIAANPEDQAAAMSQLLARLSRVVAQHLS
ncbi:membrane integrity-associated transporter subunit PqiC [Acidithiobacillus sp. M4-SHS-6]|uniref:PqiC family protein n=1 Tax=Acidithiobacillus sp. M4-SHS-6 TaxID=3383024 RepID=UPI0039BE498C